jgi:hypothetical protein
MGATRWEYRTAVLDFADLEDKLNAWGLRGWELVGFTSVTTDVPVRIAEDHYGMTPVTSYQIVMRKPMGAHPEELERSPSSSPSVPSPTPPQAT